MCADAPDESGINAAAVANANLSKESLDFYKKIYAEQAPARDAAAVRANQVSDAQLLTMGQNNKLAQDYADYAKNTFRPVEQGIVNAAQIYDVQAKGDQQAGKAMADVSQQFGVAREQSARNLSRSGVDPSSGRALAMNANMGMAEATAKAAASTNARTQADTQGYARKMDAANLGRGLASNQATSAGVAMSAGNSAVNNAGIPLTQASQAASQMGQGFNTAMQGNSSAGQLYASAAQVGKNDGMLGDLASIGMSGAKLYATSDKNLKKNIEPVSDAQALKAVEKTPVSTWDYKDGAGDGGHHMGPMAQHVQKNIGERAGPGGRAVDLVTLNGVNMAATAALSRKVDKLAKSIKGMTR